MAECWHENENNYKLDGVVQWSRCTCVEPRELHGQISIEHSYNRVGIFCILTHRHWRASVAGFPRPCSELAEHFERSFKFSWWIFLLWPFLKHFWRCYHAAVEFRESNQILLSNFIISVMQIFSLQNCAPTNTFETPMMVQSSSCMSSTTAQEQ